MQKTKARKGKQGERRQEIPGNMEQSPLSDKMPTAEPPTGYARNQNGEFGFILQESSKRGDLGESTWQWEFKAGRTFFPCITVISNLSNAETLLIQLRMLW